VDQRTRGGQDKENQSRPLLCLSVSLPLSEILRATYLREVVVPGPFLLAVSDSGHPGCSRHGGTRNA
jgi:hypothetical protein